MRALTDLAGVLAQPARPGPIGPGSQQRPLLKRGVRGRSSIAPSCSALFGPHKPASGGGSREVAPSAHSPRHVQAAGLETQDVGLELQQRKLDRLFHLGPPPAAEVPGAEQQASTSGRGNQVTPASARPASPSNAIVPTGARRGRANAPPSSSGGNSGVGPLTEVQQAAAALGQQLADLERQLTAISAPPPAAQPVRAAALAEVQQAAAQLEQQLAEVEQQLSGQPKRRARRSKATGESSEEVAAAAAAVAAGVAAQPEAEPAAAPKRRGRRKKSELLAVAAEALAAEAAEPAAPVPQLATAATAAVVEGAASRLRRRRSASQPAAALEAAAGAQHVAAAVEAPKPRRRRRTKAEIAAAEAAAAEAPAAATTTSSSSSDSSSGGEMCLDGVLAAVEELAAAAGLASPQQPPAPSSAADAPMAEVATAAPAAPQAAAAAAEVLAAPPAAAPAAQPAAAAPAAVAAQPVASARLVPSTRAGGGEGPAAAATGRVARPSPALTRRVRLVPNLAKQRVQAEKPDEAALAAASASQRRRLARAVLHPSALLVKREQLQDAAQEAQLARLQAAQPTEGERDAAYLAKMWEGLASGRRKRGAGGSGPSGSMTMFLGRLGNTPVLRKEHEMRLARILQKGRHVQAAATALAESLGRAPEPAEVAAAAGLAAEEASLRLTNQEEAKDLLVQYNLRLVVHIAKRYANQGVSLSDLIAEGEMGLRKSIERYDPDRGFRFSTYAHWYIRQPISRAVAEQGRDVRLPVHICEQLTKIHRMEQELNKDPARSEPATREEVARALGMPLPRMLHFLRLAKSPRVVAAMGEGTTLTTASMKEVLLEEQWEDEEYTEALEDVDTFEFLKQNVSFALSTLPKRERNILRMRYGLLQQDGGNPHAPPFPLTSSMDEDGEEAAAAAAALAQPLPSSPVDEAAAAAVAQQAGASNGTAAAALGVAPPLGAPQELSLTDVSFAYGLSKERIRQIEDRALRALRNPWRVRLLHEINNGNRLSAGTLAHLAAAARPARRSGANGTTAQPGPYFG